MRAARLQNALNVLSVAMREVEEALQEIQKEHDPLALHIFVSRRSYQRIEDSKSGRRRETAARLTFHEACELGFRGNFDDWQKLMGAQRQR